MAARKKSASRKPAAKKKAAKKSPKSRKPRAAARKKVATRAQASPALADLDNRIAILRLGFSPPVTAATPRRDAADLLIAQTPACRR